jgi:diguanylate cyclase
VATTVLSAVRSVRGVRGTHRFEALLAVAPWVVMTIGTIIASVHLDPSGQAPDSILIPGLALTFASLVVRLLVGAIQRRERRFAYVVLLLALALWAAGSAQVNAAAAGAMSHFPAPGEWLFLASAVAMAAYLVLDVASRIRPSLTDWLEAVVASGGAICLVALLVLTPFSDEFGRQGVALLVALIYPVTDAVLLAFVVAQMVLRKRAVSPATFVMLTGLVLLTAADTFGSAVNILAGTYAFGLAADVCWCFAFILITQAACQPRREPRPASDSSFGAHVTLAAAAVALGVLVAAPLGPARLYVVVPATVTFIAAGARLAIALRDARNAAEAYRLSRTDELTGLPNRRAVVSDLAAGMASDIPLTVVLLDLDGFKEINDSLGHSSGDALLQIIARRLRHALPDDITAARLGSDEFALVLTERDAEAVTELAGDMRRLISRPIHLDGLEVSVNCSAGIATRSLEIATRGDLLRCADVAMTLAKRSGAGVVLYDPGQDEFSRARLALAEELRHGLEKGQLIVWYQPQVETRSGRTVSVEALVRWKHPTQGLLAPFSFLPVARRAGLMPRLTEVVLETAARDLAVWRNRGIDVSVAVNIAPPELLGGTILPELTSIMAAQDVPTDRLIVEVTEDSFLADPEHARKVIHDLRAQDVQVSIDDYGTGFSSLAYLRDLPLQELKIDRTFVAHILDDRRSWMIVSTTNELAHGLGLRTVAEGVEDDDVRAELSKMGIDVLQGYHFARPMPAEHLVGWLEGRGTAGKATHLNARTG